MVSAKSRIDSLAGKVVASRTPMVAASSAAGDAGDEAGEREAPGLVEGDVDAGGHGAGLALADQRPGAARARRGG